MILAEGLLLIALDDERGKDEAAWGSDHGLAGALLLDLAADGHVNAVDGRLEPSAQVPTHPALRAAHEVIAADDKRRKPDDWVGRLPSKLKPIKGCVAGPLVDAGVLDEQRRKRLGVFETVTYPTVDPGPERELRDGLRDVLVRDAEPTPFQARLIALLEALDLVKHVVDKDDRKAAKARAKEVAERSAETKAVKDTMEGIQSAVLVSVIASTAATTAATTGS